MKAELQKRESDLETGAIKPVQKRHIPWYMLWCIFTAGLLVWAKEYTAAFYLVVVGGLVEINNWAARQIKERDELIDTILKDTERCVKRMKGAMDEAENDPEIAAAIKRAKQARRAKLN